MEQRNDQAKQNSRWQKISEQISNDYYMLTLTKPRKKKDTVIKTKKKTPMDKYRWGKRFFTIDYANSPIDEEAKDIINAYYKSQENCIYKQTHVDSIAILETLLFEQDVILHKYNFSQSSKISVETYNTGFNITLRQLFKDDEEEGELQLATLVLICSFKPNYRRVYKVGITIGTGVHVEPTYIKLFHGSIECQRTVLQLPSNEIIPT
jgi:hypothetical protein